MSASKSPPCCPHCRKVILSEYQRFILADVEKHPETTSMESWERLKGRHRLRQCNIHSCFEYLRKEGFLTRSKGYEKRWRYSPTKTNL